MKLFLDIANENKKYKTTTQKRLFVQYKQVFTILHLKIQKCQNANIIKPHILAFTTLLQIIWESDFAVNLWNNRKKRNITISILSGAGALRQHK